MDISLIGTVNSYVKNTVSCKNACNSEKSCCRDKTQNTDKADFSSKARAAENIETEKADEKKTVSEIIEGQSEKIRDIFGDTNEERERKKLCGIRMKIYNGQQLTPAEQAYIEQKDANAYSNYQRNERARKMYRSMLKCCRTRDQVNSMRLSNSLSALSEFRKSARSGGSGTPAVCMNAIMESETREFVKSAEFKRLPSNAECNKFDRDLAKAKKFEREKRAAERKEAIEKRKNVRDKKKKLKKTPGDGKQTVAQVMSSPSARKVLKSRRNTSSIGISASESVSYIYKMNLKA